MYIYNKMSNSKIILQTTGEQDKYLTTNPNHTHFKSNYRQYTQFGNDWIVLNNNNKGTADYIKKDSSYYFRIEKDGDLINNLYIRLKLKEGQAWGPESGNFKIYETIFKIIKNVEFLNNDSVIASMSSDYMFSYFELHYTKAEKMALANLISYDKASKSPTDEYVYLYLPLPLWFHKNPGQAFPLWALNNPNIGINVKTNNYTEAGGQIFDLELLVDFGFLNTEEKQQFTNKSLEYLIEVPEMLESATITGSDAMTKKINLVKTHYVRYLLWNIKNEDNVFEYKNDLVSADINFNGNTLISNAPGSFYDSLSRYINFESNGTLYTSTGDFNKIGMSNIYTYSFCLNPLSKKLSGYFTTEKFNNVEMSLSIKAGAANRKLNIYLVKHNLMRINNGVLNMLYN